MHATLRLFKALPIERHDLPGVVDEAITAATLDKGFVLAPAVSAAYPDPRYILSLIEQAYGPDSAALNATFHKSFAKVRDTSLRQLVFEQMVHYLTTYGAEALGVYDRDSVFIPGERLAAPELRAGVRLVVIRGLTKDELRAELLQLLASGVALHEQTVKDALEIATFVGFTADDIERVRNREVQAGLYYAFGVVPLQPVEFLRLVVYHVTERTLLIKNQALIEAIKGKQHSDVARYFDIYEREVGLGRLAEIFYRYKPIFLAFRTTARLKQTINKIRRLARDHHRPMPEDLLNTVTARLSRGERLDMEQFATALAGANTFRKVRLAYALKFRTARADSILYRVRNGKSYATAFRFDNRAGAQNAYAIVLASIIDDLARNVRGKKIFIPQCIRYGVPATEKQFTGHLPTGTHIAVGENMVCGVHWENQGGHRIDLDLSVSNANGKLGWDARYRDSEQGIYFSGDITDAPAPDGASELFHIGGEARGTWIMFVNYFNHHDDVPVPFKIVVGSAGEGEIDEQHTIDPNRLLAFSDTTIDVEQKNLGLIVADGKGATFYFAESNLGKGITSRDTAYAEHARTFLQRYYTEAIVLNDLLVAAGAIMVEAVGDADIDLSPEAINKATIIGLLTPTDEQRR